MDPNTKFTLNIWNRVIKTYLYKLEKEAKILRWLAHDRGFWPGKEVGEVWYHSNM